MSLLPVVEALEASAIATAMRQSAYFSAVVNVIHLLGLVVFAGAILIVDLRLLGGGIKKQPVAQVARDAQPWLIGALLVMLCTGIPQIILTPTKQYYSPYFWLKMEILPVALIFTFTVRRMVALADEGRVHPVWRKLTGLVSIAMWTVVPVCGRLIGLLS
jgi:hypothetical protein